MFESRAARKRARHHPTRRVDASCLGCECGERHSKPAAPAIQASDGGFRFSPGMDWTSILQDAGEGPSRRESSLVHLQSEPSTASRGVMPSIMPTFRMRSMSTEALVHLRGEGVGTDCPSAS